jgi:hypothetical protein
MKRILGGWLLASGWLAGYAADYSHLYPAATLQTAGEHYKVTTTRILDQLIWPALLSEEKAALGNRKPVLEFPVFDEAADKGIPLTFYSVGGGMFGTNRVVAPLLSLKLLDDLSTVYAWLQANNYTLETISEYTALLHRSEVPPPGGYPQPLAVLGIPANALNQKDVAENALGHFVTARTFILAHEIGHLRYRHGGRRSSAESIRDEEQADRFAIDVMKRIHLPPLGMLVFFLFDADWSVYPANANATHPLSGARVRALASEVDDPVLKMKLMKFGADMDSPEARAGFAATGVAGDWNALGPRHYGELPHLASRAPAGGTKPFDGVYRGELVQFLDPGPMRAEFTLERHDDSVTGSFTIGIGFFRIKSGHVVGNKLYFDWQFGSGSYGRGELESDGHGGFTGTWGYRESRTGAGTMKGSRVPGGAVSVLRSLGR